MNKYIATILLILSLSAALFAQTYTHLPYFEGFEDPQTVADWHLNVGADGFTNKWYISSAERYMGTQSLLISNDGGISATYSNLSNSVVAYREFFLQPGQYDLSFAWRCMGQTDVDGLYVCWIPASVDISSSLMGLPNMVDITALPINGKQIINGSSTWQIATIALPPVTQTSSGAPEAYKLLFVWDNNEVQNADFSVCIDNIQLAFSSCNRPMGITSTYSDGQTNLSWTGSADSYQVIYRSYGSSSVDTIPRITTTSVTIPGLDEGYHDFFVRGICASGDTSIWAAHDFKMLYDVSAHCIDFINFTDPDTKCTTGTFYSPYEKEEVRDEGFESVESCHTVHSFPGETDPRTNGELVTVPEGEVVSVRLGNWEIGAKAESITYTYSLDDDANIIMTLKYAVVYQDPSHTVDHQPRFTMEILNAAGNPIDAKCGAADFRADRNMPGWNVIDNGDGNVVVWKDWTTVGINLTPYAGQTVKIRFTTYDCQESGHYGYAYYTLSCAQASISGLTCGAVSTEVSAPDGFNYKWYKPETPDDIVSTERTLIIDESDADTFYCDVIFKEKQDCRFTLTANLLPRFPEADFVPDWRPDSCKNFIRFRNVSGVSVLGKLTGERCTSYLWDFGDGRTSVEQDPIVEYPVSGGQYSVRLQVGISENLCVDDTVITFTVPPVAPSDTTIYRSICRGGRPLRIDGVTYREAGTYTINKKTLYTKCDSVITLVIDEIDEVSTVVYDTICVGEAYDFNGITCTEQDTYTKRFNGGSSGGCDSIVTLHLHVLDTLSVSLSDIPEICADDSEFLIPYNVLQGYTDSYALIFDDKSHAAGFIDADTLPLTDGAVRVVLPDNVRPDYYSVGVCFNVDKCSENIDTIHVPFCVHYPNSILAQKWNDVVAVYNSSHPLGGYEFAAYNWYKDGQLLPDENGSYLYIGEQGLTLDTGATYRAGLVRHGETMMITTCPFIPTIHTDITDYITVNNISAGQPVALKGIQRSGEAVWYTVAGQVLFVEEIDSFTDYIHSPHTPGIYMVCLTFDNEVSVHKIVVK